MHKNGIKYSEKRLKHAVFYANNLPTDLDQAMRTIEKRYPYAPDMLMQNPYPVEKKKGKKKKKK